MTQQLVPNTSAPRFGVETDKHVLFGLAGETYCLNLIQLQEVIADYQVTVLPNLPDYFHGVIGLRGEVIPVLNLRQRFGFAERARDRQTRLLVVDMDPNPIGVVVDEVFRVVTIARGSIEHAPEMTCGQRAPFVLGVSECGQGKLAIHLDMHNVLSSLEKIQLAELSERIRESYRASQAEPSEAPQPAADHEPTVESDADDDGWRIPASDAPGDDPEPEQEDPDAED